MTDKDEAKQAPKWEAVHVHHGELTETLTIPEGTIYRTTHFHEHGTDIPGHTTDIPAAVAMVFVPSGPNPDDH
jgi:hypothetical protein